MKKSITIPKNVSTNNDLDYNFLRKEGLKYIEKLGSELWTDYNTHDPGITILEMLSYAITDLSQRMEMPFENLLASEKDNVKHMHEQFLSALEILPSKPVSALDYRKLFAHIKGVKNSWMRKHKQNVFISCKHDPPKWSYKPFKILPKNQENFTLKGLNDIYIDLEDDVNQKQVFALVRKAYMQNRNLCEDLVDISVIPEQRICMCANIDLDSNADEEKVQANILIAIEEYLSPSLKFYSLVEMQNKGYTTDQIFEGPVPMPGACVSMSDFKQGFIDYSELRKADLRTEVRLSDLIRIIMEVAGVKEVNDISINSCKDQSDDASSWVIPIKNNHKPVLCVNKSVFNFSKGLLPVDVDNSMVQLYIDQNQVDVQNQMASIKTEDIAFPEGEYSSPDQYTTIQNDFPQTYGISSFGLSSDVSEKRKAQAKQLKAYLLFFDQILANYFAHLAKAKDLLSVDENLKSLYIDKSISLLTKSSEEFKKATQTHFTQKVDGISDLDKVISSSEYSTVLIESMRESLTEPADQVFYRKRNELLDHLIARFAEQFGEYVFIMKKLYGDDADDKTLEAKINFLLEYKKVSCERGAGFDYCNPGVWDTKNVSGASRRIARLAGIIDYSRRDLLSEAIEIYDEKDESDDLTIEFRWRLKKKKQILLSSSKHYPTIHHVFKELFKAIDYADDSSNYAIIPTKSGKRFYLNLIDPAITDPDDEDRVIARRITYYTTIAAAKKARDEIVAYVNDLSLEEEGLYMVEHILLRPIAPYDEFMESCLGADCEIDEPIDPYSYRVTVILPGWTTRFRNIDFRKYLEKIIRDELPAHVLPRICWIGHVKGMTDSDDENDMLQLQKKYKAFLIQLHYRCINQALSKSELNLYHKVLGELTTQLNRLNTIYPAGKLHDCDDDEAEGNKILLGKTSLGKL